MKAHAPTLAPSMSQHEILAELATPITSYLEVGVQEGKSLRVVVEAAPSLLRLVLCDDWGARSGGTGRGSHEHVAAMLDQLNYRGDVTWLDGRSQDTLPAWYAQLGYMAPVDLVHVDGEHSEEGCLADLRNGWRACAGAMVVHDVSMPGVWKALVAFGGEHQEQIADAFLAFKGHGTAVLQKELER